MRRRKINPDIEEFANKVLEEFFRTLTDQLFVCIGNNKDFLKRFNELGVKYGEGVVNQDLGLLFKNLLDVANLKRNYNPISDLIQSYTEHTLPSKK